MKKTRNSTAQGEKKVELGGEENAVVGAEQSEKYTLADALALVIIALQWDRFFPTAIEIASEITGISIEEIGSHIKNTERLWKR